MKAVKKVYPGDKNSSTTLRIWEEYGLWPPSEEILSGGAAGEGRSRIQGKNGLKVINGAGKKNFESLKTRSDDSDHVSELSEKEFLLRVGKILDSIGVHHMEWTGGPYEEILHDQDKSLYRSSSRRSSERNS